MHTQYHSHLHTLKLAYSLGYVSIYYVYFSHHMRSLAKSSDSHVIPFRSLKDIQPIPDGAKQWFNPYLTQLAWSFFKQSLLKQLLTDGKILTISFIGFAYIILTFYMYFFFLV